MNCRILTACATIHHNSYYWNCQEWDTGRQKHGEKSSHPEHKPVDATFLKHVQFSSLAQSCLTLWDPVDCSTPGFPSITNSWSWLKLMSIESVMPSNFLILCHALLLPPLIFPRIRIFSNESVLRIIWPKNWSFSFSISPSNKYSGLISFRMD